MTFDDFEDFARSSRAGIWTGMGREGGRAWVNVRKRRISIDIKNFRKRIFDFSPK